MKLPEQKYTQLLSLSENYFDCSGLNPAAILLMDLISKQKANKEVETSVRIRDYFKKIRNKVDLIFNKTSDFSRKHDLLFFINEPTHYNQVIGILKELDAQKKNYIVLTNKIKNFKQLRSKKINVNFFVIKNTVSPGTGYGMLKKNITQFLHAVKERSLLDHTELSAFTSLLNSSSIMIFNYYTFFKSALQSIRAKTVVIGNDLSLIGRILAFICREEKIKTIVIQHGTIPVDPIHKYHLADQLYIFGSKARKVLRNFGIDEKRINVTGAPYLDDKLFHRKTAKVDKLRKYFKINKSDKIVLIAFSGSGQRTSLKHHKGLIGAIGVLAGKFPEYKFLIKLHRKDNIKFYIEIKKRFKNVLIKPKIKNSVSNDIFDWLETSDILITGNSSVATEAMLMKKPVMTIDLMNEYPFMDFIAEGAALHSKSVEEVESNFKNITSNNEFLKAQLNKQYDFINQYFYSPDGKTSEKCAELISNS